MRNITCPAPLVPVYTKFHDDPYANGTRKIPRYLHLSQKSRCLPAELYESITRWQKALPHHTIVYHDDEAVDRLLYETEWPEFPHLKRLMNCVKFKGAMKIDVWRLLVVYRYGGIYTDCDNWPVLFNETVIRPTDEALSLSDSSHRPSQWFFAAVPRHPVLYYAVLQVLKNLFELPDIAQLNIVFITGPGAFNDAYTQFFSGHPEARKISAPEGFEGVGKFGRHFRKIGRYDTDGLVLGNLGRTYDDIVDYNGTKMKRRRKVELEYGVVHWLKVASSKRPADFPSGPCKDYLYQMMLDEQNTTVPM